jgi:hypothetical protein
MTRGVDYTAPPDAKPWERQTKETGQAFAAFIEYRKMGVDRSLRKLSPLQKRSETILTKWCKHWNWVKRVAAAEADEDRRLRDLEIQALHDMRKRHLGFSQGMQKIGQYKIKVVLDAIAAGQNPEVPLDLATKLLEIGMKLERLLRGEPDTIAHHTLGVGDRRMALRKLFEDKKASAAIKQLTNMLVDSDQKE